MEYSRFPISDEPEKNLRKTRVSFFLSSPSRTSFINASTRFRTCFQLVSQEKRREAAQAAKVEKMRSKLNKECYRRPSAQMFREEGEFNKVQATLLSLNAPQLPSKLRPRFSDLLTAWTASSVLVNCLRRLSFQPFFFYRSTSLLLPCKLKAVAVRCLEARRITTAAPRTKI